MSDSGHFRKPARAAVRQRILPATATERPAVIPLSRFLRVTMAVLLGFRSVHLGGPVCGLTCFVRVRKIDWWGRHEQIDKRQERRYRVAGVSATVKTRERRDDSARSA